MQNTIINQIITGEFKMERSQIATKYQTIRKDDMDKLRIDIVTTARLTDPIFVTPEYQIIDGWKRLLILQELQQEGVELTVKPTVIIVEDNEQQEKIYISKNVIVNRYKKSWLAVIAAENNLPENRRIANARRGIKQEEPYDACTAAGLAFGISGKLVQQADDVLKSPEGLFLRNKIRNEEMTVTNAFEIVSRQLDSILNEMINGKTYRQAMNDFSRDGQGNRQHEKFQERQKQIAETSLENEVHMSASVALTVQSEDESKPAITPTPVPSPIETSKTGIVSNQPQAGPIQRDFFGALSADYSPEFKADLEQLMKKHMPGSYIVSVKNQKKLWQLIEENNLIYSDVVQAA